MKLLQAWDDLVVNALVNKHGIASGRLILLGVVPMRR
jgi:hypothetical protein